MKSYIDTRIKEEQERIGSHNKVSYDRYMEIVADALRKMKTDTKTSAIDKNGEFQDFFEVRRPFIAPNNESATN